MSVVMELNGELDLTAAADTHGMLRLTIALHGPELILDLNHLVFMDCAGLRVILQARTYCENRGGYLHLARPRGTVRRLLALVQEEAHLTILDDIRV